MTQMGFFAWLIVGAIAGWLAGRVMHSRLGLVGDIVVGIIGAFIGGFLFSLVGIGGASGFNLWSIFVAFIGGVVLLYAARLVTMRQGGIRV